MCGWRGSRGSSSPRASPWSTRTRVTRCPSTFGDGSRCAPSRRHGSSGRRRTTARRRGRRRAARDGPDPDGWFCSPPPPCWRSWGGFRRPLAFEGGGGGPPRRPNVAEIVWELGHGLWHAVRESSERVDQYDRMRTPIPGDLVIELTHRYGPRARIDPNRIGWMIGGDAFRPLVTPLDSPDRSVSFDQGVWIAPPIRAGTLPPHRRPLAAGIAFLERFPLGEHPELPVLRRDLQLATAREQVLKALAHDPPPTPLQRAELIALRERGEP